MATAPAIAGAAQGKSSLMMFIVVVLLLSLVGAGTGFAVGALLSKPGGDARPAPVAGNAPVMEKTGEKTSEKTIAHEAAKSEGEVAEPPGFAPPVEPDVPTAIVPLAPIITNLAAPEGAWVRIEGSLLAVQDSKEKPEVLAEKMTSDLLGYLRTIRLSQIEGASGFLAFRDDLDDFVRTASGGDVRRFLIKSLVVE